MNELQDIATMGNIQEFHEVTIKNRRSNGKRIVLKLTNHEKNNL